MQRLSLPPGYQVSQGGETEDPREVFGRILLALAVAVMLMYRITAPIAIMASRDRRRDHVHGAHAARDSDVLRHAGERP